MENLNLFKTAKVYTPSEIIINLLLSLIFGLAISLIYKKTHKRLKLFSIFYDNQCICLGDCLHGNNDNWK